MDYGPTIILEHKISKELAFYALYGHLTKDSLANMREGKTVKKGDVVGRVGSIAENGGWPPHLHFQIITDLLGKRGDFIVVGPPSQRDLWLSLCPDPNLILQIPLGQFVSSSLDRTRAEIISLRQQYLGSNLSIAYKRPLKIVRGFMQYLYDENGQRYLDASQQRPSCWPLPSPGGPGSAKSGGRP